jgi:hypothetical protein
MKLGFICPSVPSHLNPMTALARRLQARNRDVVFLYSSGDFEHEQDDQLDALAEWWRWNWFH